MSTPITAAMVNDLRQRTGLPMMECKAALVHVGGDMEKAIDHIRVTGEHGVGVEKLNSMCVQFAPAERAQFMAVKHAFDPLELLNPGKVIPTLHRCAEYGKMHVHRGLLPFADLPRF